MALFAPSSKTPGHGLIHAKLLPPHSFTLQEMQFVYPLKLISSSKPTDKHITIFILSYGGGLVSNDRVDMKVVLEENVKMCLLTQGSTKVFKLRPGDTLTAQSMTVYLASGSSLVLLPDPVQPFASSVYKQHQQFHIPKDGTASLVILDWISEGRSARGEQWELKDLTSRNEVYELGHDNFPGGKRLLFRDSLILAGDEGSREDDESLKSRMDGLVCICTLIVRGPKFANLSAHILSRFQSEPRIGKGGRGWNWDKNKQDENSMPKFKDITWSTSEVRGFVLVKVSGKEIEEVRRFLRDVLLEGKNVNADDVDEVSPDIIREYGLGSLRCLE